MYSKNLPTLAFLTLIGLQICHVRAEDGFKGCSLTAAGVAAVVSPVPETTGQGQNTSRLMEVLWWGLDDIQAGDWMGLWSHDPEEDIQGFLDSINFDEAAAPDGHEVFLVLFNSTSIPADVSTSPSGSCLPYWVGYVQKGNILYKACLRINPHWQSELEDVLNDVPLVSVLLPGTHDAGASTFYYNWSSDGVVSDNVAMWTFTQDDGLYDQLVMGVRYLDMRISYYPEKEFLYYVNHGDVLVAPLYLYLEDIAKFMSQTNEVVIFDIHSLEHDFNSYVEAAPGLYSLLVSYFEQWIVPNLYEPNPTMGTLWNIGKRLIVTYPDSFNNDYYWKSVYHLWGNVNTLDNLLAFFDEEIPMQSGRGSLWSAMTEFTPSAEDIFVFRWGGLTGAANITNLPVSLRVRRDWWTGVNVVAMDFVLGSDVISSVIEANTLKFSCV